MSEPVPGNSAILLIDFQNSFFRADGVLARLRGAVHGADGIIARTVEMVSAARRARIPLIYTQHMFREDYADIDRVFRDFLPEAMTMGGLRKGGWDVAVVDELEPAPGDLVITKNRFDGFFRTDLEPALHERGISGLAVAGALTNMCVETTVRSAFQRDLFVHVLTDCCGARTPTDHDRALSAMAAGKFATLGGWHDWLSGDADPRRH